MKPPHSLWLLATHSHPDALDDGIKIETILAQFIYKVGVDVMTDVQHHLSESLKTDTPAMMELRWEEAESGLDFMEFTEEFFQKVVNFDTIPFINSNPYK